MNFKITFCKFYDIDQTLFDTLKMNIIPLQRIIKEETGMDLLYEEMLRFVPYSGMKVMEELQVLILVMRHGALSVMKE